MPLGKRWMDDATAALLSIALLIGCVILWEDAGNTRGIDFYQYWAVAHRLVDVAPIGVYTETARGTLLRWLKSMAQAPGATKRMIMIASARDHFATYQTPLLYTIYHFVLSGNYDFDYRCYQAVLILCYVMGVLGMCHALGYRTEGMIAAAVVLIHSYPFVTDVQLGNVNSLQFMFVALYIFLQSYSNRKHLSFMGGIVLGLMFVFKPNLAHVPLVLAVTRLAYGQHRTLGIELAGMLAGCVAGFVVSSIVLGSPFCWIDWFMAVATIPEAHILYESGNFSLGRPLWNAFGPAGPLLMSGTMVLVVTGLIWLGGNRSRTSAGNRDNDKGSDMAVAVSVALGCLIYLLSSRLSWTHNFMLTTPMLLLGFRPFDSHDPQPYGRVAVRRVLAGIAALGLTSFAVYPPIEFSTLMSAVVLNTAAVSLFVLGLLELMWNRPAPITVVS